MPAAQPAFPDDHSKLMSDFGARLRAARARRRLSAQEVADRSGISRMTLHRAEKGDPVVGLGTYLRIMATLRIEGDLALLAQADELGMEIEAASTPGRKPRKFTPISATPVYSSAGEMSDAQRSREVAQALLVNEMPAAMFSKWIHANWGSLQRQANSLYAGVTPSAETRVRHFKSLAEKNEFDRGRETAFAVEMASQA